jgi:hypothetical protein
MSVARVCTSLKANAMKSGTIAARIKKKEMRTDNLRDLLVDAFL